MSTTVTYDIPGEYGHSDFDARHRFVLSSTCVLPFGGHLLVRGWQLATIVQSPSGNPLDIVTGNSTLNGVPNTIRPDVTGPHPQHRLGGPVVRSVGVRTCRPLRQPGPQCRLRPGRPFRTMAAAGRCS
jgi:hypothetical protein